MIAAILAYLVADSALMALLTGGLYTTMISRQDTPGAFDANRELRPCGFLRASSDVADGPSTHMRAGRMIPEIYLYQRPVGSYAVIGPAAARIRILLHETRIVPATGGAWPITWANDIPNRDDTNLVASLWITRYAASYTYPAA